MSTYSQGYEDGRSSSSGWGDFFGFIGFMFAIIVIGGMVRGWGAEAERKRIDDLLRPLGTSVEHLEKQAEIAKAVRLTQPLPTVLTGKQDSMEMKVK